MMVGVQASDPGPRPWLTRNVRVLSAVSFLQDAASDLLYPLLPIYLTSVLGAPPAIVGAVEGAAEAAASLTKLAAGPLGDRFARRPLIATGYGMAAFGKVIVAAATAWVLPLARVVVLTETVDSSALIALPRTMVRMRAGARARRRRRMCCQRRVRSRFRAAPDATAVRA